MGEHTEKQFKTEARQDTHPERKGVGVLSTEEELSKSETRQRYTPGEECGRPEGGAQ